MKSKDVKNINNRELFNIEYDCFMNPKFVYSVGVDSLFFGDRANDILKRKKNLAYVYYCFKVLE